MEKDFKELIQLLKLDSSNDLFVFENGKIKPYKNLLEFQYHLSNLHELVLSEVSNTVKPSKELIIEVYDRFIANLNQNKESIMH